MGGGRGDRFIEEAAVFPEESTPAVGGGRSGPSDGIRRNNWWDPSIVGGGGV